MAKKTAFILNDETILNSHGFMILNSGGIFDRFNENPVMLDAHDSDSCLNVIGKWGPLKVENGLLLSEPDFDMEDENAAKIAGKVERGFVKGASMGIYILEAELRDIPVLGVQPVVTSWELLEASPVPVPSNRGSLRLYAADRKTLLQAEQIKLSIEKISQKKPIMEKITLSVEAAKVLGLGKEPEISDLNAAIMELSASLKAETAEKTIAQEALSAYKLGAATTFAESAVLSGQLTADKKEAVIKLHVKDPKEAEDLIALYPKKETFSSKVTNLEKNKQSTDRENWDYMRWLKEANAELQAMQVSEPERFAKLKADYKSKY